MPAWTPIPGETPIDPSGLKPKGLRRRAELNEAEFDNIRLAAAKYLIGPLNRRKAPFHLSWTQRLHREMCGKVWRWAGVFRRHDLNIGCPWQHVEQRLEILLRDLGEWDAGADPIPILRQTAMLHHRAVQIHPFENGNGRWARMLANIWLGLHSQPLTHWPEHAIGAEGTDREKYIAALKLADDGDYDALVEQHRQLAEIPLGWLSGESSTRPPIADPSSPRPWLHGQTGTDPQPPGRRR